MVLEWLDGQTLEADLAARPGPRSLAETMALLGPVLEAMAHAHALGVIHRDLSTTNIFLARRGEGATAGTMAKVLDFGVAKVIGDNFALGPRAATLAQIKIFSPAYAAPEQFDARLAPAGPQTDVYSLALIAVEVLTGRMVLAVGDDWRNDAARPRSKRGAYATRLGCGGGRLRREGARARSLD